MTLLSFLDSLSPRMKRVVTVCGAMLLFAVVTLGIYAESWAAQTSRLVFDLLQLKDKSLNQTLTAFWAAPSLELLWKILWSPSAKLVVLLFVFCILESCRPALVRICAILWRGTKTRSVFELWLRSSVLIDNASEKLTDCINFLTQLSVEVLVLIVRAVVVFLTFVGMLWGLSSYFSDIPGFLLWVVMLYCAIQTLVSYKISGGRLLALQDSNRDNESAYRKTVIQIEKLKEGGASLRDLISAERAAFKRFSVLQQGYLETIPHTLHLDTWNNLNQQVWAQLPLAIFSIVYMASDPSSGLTLGVLTQTTFTIVVMHGALSFSPETWVKLNLIQTYRARLRELETRIQGSEKPLRALQTKNAT